MGHHLPTHTCCCPECVVQQIMSALDGNPSATSSVENGSAALPEAPSLGESTDESDSVDVTADQSVAANDTGLLTRRDLVTRVDVGRGKSVAVILVEPTLGKRRLTAWC